MASARTTAHPGRLCKHSGSRAWPWNGPKTSPPRSAFLAGQTLADHWLVWGGDGRITSGHVEVLAERATAEPLQLISLDGATSEG